MGVVKNAAAEKKHKARMGNTASSRQADFRFVECDLVASDKAEIRAYLDTGELGAETVEALVADGYDYALKRDKRGNGYMATLIDRGDESPFLNACLVGRGSDPAMARAALLYKHVYKLAGDWAGADSATELDFG